jgi:Ctr copper transporter family
MIAVMTMNVGYFFAVLVGVFFGELFFGRLITSGHARAAAGANIESTVAQQ